MIVHLAARAGVRPSILDPIGYQDVNVKGTQNLLELAKELRVPQFVFASSSSVYGVNPNVPWSEEDHVLLPISPYASTKVSGELLGHVYSHLYDIRFVALRFFTVFGPRQRPDLAIHKFARRMADGQTIPVFGDGSMRRDYTFVDDIVAGIRGAMDTGGSPFEVVNLGNNQTVTLLEMIRGLEQAIGLRRRDRLAAGAARRRAADVGERGEGAAVAVVQREDAGLARRGEVRGVADRQGHAWVSRLCRRGRHVDSPAGCRWSSQATWRTPQRSGWPWSCWHAGRRRMRSAIMRWRSPFAARSSSSAMCSSPVCKAPTLTASSRSSSTSASG